MDTTQNIKYYTDLSAQKRNIAGMAFVIVFLAGGWGATVFNYSEYRNKKENQLINVERRCAEVMIKSKDEEVLKQTIALRLKDSTNEALKEQLIKIQVFLNPKK